MRTIHRRIVTGYIVSSDGKLLLGHKDAKKGGVYTGYWHNPGGGVDEGETDEQALSREIMEETGIDIGDAHVKLIDSLGHGESVRPWKDGDQVLAKMQFNVYKVTLDRPAAQVTLRQSDDLVDLQWFPVTDVRSIGLTPPALELFGRIGVDWLVP